MSSLISGEKFPLEQFFSEPVFYLNAVTPRYAYEGQKRTDTILGYTYLATNTGNYRQIRVFMEGRPVVEPDELLDMQEAEKKLFVEFTGAVVKPYYSERTRQLEDSIKAESVQTVENHEKLL